MTMITVDDYLDAFKEMCNYDEFDAKHFGAESLEAIIRDDHSKAALTTALCSQRKHCQKL